MIEGELIGLVSNVGFPIAIAFYVMMRLENTLKENTKAVNQMISLISQLITKIN